MIARSRNITAICDMIYLGEEIGAAKIISLRSHRDKSRHAAGCHGAPTTVKVMGLTYIHTYICDTV